MTCIQRSGLQRGIGLVELMIAITLSLVLTAAVIQVFVSSKNNYRVQDSVSILQENGRFAISYLAEDIRMAGFTGCSSVDKVVITNNVNGLTVGSNTQADPSSVLFDTSSIVRGVDNVAAGDATFDSGAKFKAVLGTDVLIVRHAVSGGANVNAALATTTSDITIPGTNALGLKVNDVFIISDCSNVDVVRATSAGTASGVQTLGHGTAVNTTNTLSKAYGKESEVLALQVTTYFIGDTGRKTAQNSPILALYVVMRTAGQGGVLDLKDSYKAELVEGVEDMQLEYGIDTNGDGSADTYATANVVTATQWAKVISVRVNLLMQSTDDSAVAKTGTLKQIYSFNGADNITKADGRLRQVFYSVVGIRNRLL